MLKLWPDEPVIQWVMLDWRDPFFEREGIGGSASRMREERVTNICPRCGQRLR